MWAFISDILVHDREGLKTEVKRGVALRKGIFHVENALGLHFKPSSGIVYGKIFLLTNNGAVYFVCHKNTSCLGTWLGRVSTQLPLPLNYTMVARHKSVVIE